MERESAVAAAAEATDGQGPAEIVGRLLHGVISARRHDRALAKLSTGDDEELVRHRGLAALVHRVPYSLPDWESGRIREHSQAIERVMRRCTIVPAPYGIVFRDPDQVKEFLDDQHVALEEALSFLEGAFEMRLHIHPSGHRPGVSEREQADRAARFYTALRRRARAALPLPKTSESILSAAFLVDRAGWVAFVEHADELDADHPEYRFDLTGPWPPYDFVRIAFFRKEQAGD
jgi:glycosyltransferase involved in cell wall biosynthesis